MFTFEYDPVKSEGNSVKHGIDFRQAEVLFQDDRLVFLLSRESRERRHMAIGLLGERYWTAVFTLRTGRVRLISVRRSRKREIDLYESQ